MSLTLRETSTGYSRAAVVIDRLIDDQLLCFMLVSEVTHVLGKEEVLLMISPAGLASPLVGKVGTAEGQTNTNKRVNVVVFLFGE